MRQAPVTHLPCLVSLLLCSLHPLLHCSYCLDLLRTRTCGLLHRLALHVLLHAGRICGEGCVRGHVQNCCCTCCTASCISAHAFCPHVIPCCQYMLVAMDRDQACRKMTPKPMKSDLDKALKPQKPATYNSLISSNLTLRASCASVSSCGVRPVGCEPA